MHEKEKNGLQRLDRFNRWLVVTYWRWLLIKQTYLRQSLPMRLVPLHSIGMLVVLLGFPRAYPALVVAPVIVIASYYATILLLFILPSPRKIHWVK